MEGEHFSARGAERRAGIIAGAAILALLAWTYFFVRSYPLNHDVAWLLVATQRWASGQQLYRDVIEINPPLIFLENVLLTAGVLTKDAYLLGVTSAIGLSTAWVFAFRGARIATFSALALVASGITDYGQRDHIALVFLFPYLLTSPSRPFAQVAIGLWAFLGIGLKPHFLLIPAFFVAGQCVQMRSFRPAFTITNFIIGALCVAWLALVAVIWPDYFTRIVPLGGLVYDAFGFSPLPIHLLMAAFLIAFAILSLKQQPTLFPLACAAIGALIQFYLQGRYWPYQFVPPMGLAMFLSMELAWRERGTMGIALGSVALLLIARQALIGPHQYPPSIVPQMTSPVLFLTERVSATYPEVLECGVVNASRYPSLWTLPGSWNQMTPGSPNQAHANDVFRRETAIISQDIRRLRPVLVFEDIRPTYFKGRFTYSDWIDLSGYRPVGLRGRYRFWLRNDLDVGLLNRPLCAGLRPRR